jgi:hypothetical protein
MQFTKLRDKLQSVQLILMGKEMQGVFGWAFAVAFTAYKL